MAVVADRLPPRPTDDVACAAIGASSGVFTSLMWLLVLIGGVVGSASRPCTMAPVGSVRFPEASNVNEPARVYIVSAPERTANRPLPEIARSVGTPVV